MCLKCYHVSSCLGCTMTVCLRLGDREEMNVNREAETGRTAPSLDVNSSLRCGIVILTNKTSWCSYCGITFALLNLLHAKCVAANFIVVTKLSKLQKLGGREKTISHCKSSKSFSRCTGGLQLRLPLPYIAIELGYYWGFTQTTVPFAALNKPPNLCLSWPETRR